MCEILQNCVIFNNGTHDSVYNKEGRAKNAIYLEHGKPMLFGENHEYGLAQEGFGLKVVKLGENGITEKDILIHDAHCMDNTLQLKLALMEGPDFPIALGVIRVPTSPLPWASSVMWTSRLTMRPCMRRSRKSAPRRSIITSRNC